MQYSLCILTGGGGGYSMTYCLGKNQLTFNLVLQWMTPAKIIVRLMVEFHTLPEFKYQSASTYWTVKVYTQSSSVVYGFHIPYV